MAVKRTKKQKQNSELRRSQGLTYSMAQVNKSTSSEVFKKNETVKKKSLDFDSSYIVGDLSKTFIVTLLVVIVLIAYTIYVK